MAVLVSVLLLTLRSVVLGDSLSAFQACILSNGFAITTPGPREQSIVILNTNTTTFQIANQSLALENWVR
jgi:hypothetical protein